MKAEEKNELLNISKKNKPFEKAIQMLFQASQNVLLKSGTVTLYSYPPRIEGAEVNELKLDLNKLMKNRGVRYHPSSDVAVVSIGRTLKKDEKKYLEFLPGITQPQEKKAHILSLANEGIKMFKDVTVSNEVFMFGYPTSLATNPQIDIKRPLLRRGVVAGKNELLKTIILDCPAFYGNSGGLVLEVDRVSLVNIEFRGIGIISQLVPYAGRWIENSGYTIAVPMDVVAEMLPVVPQN
jgi:hypothetical protein